MPPPLPFTLPHHSPSSVNSIMTIIIVISDDDAKVMMQKQLSTIQHYYYCLSPHQLQHIKLSILFNSSCLRVGIHSILSKSSITTKLVIIMFNNGNNNKNNSNITSTFITTTTTNYDHFRVKFDQFRKLLYIANNNNNNINSGKNLFSWFWFLVSSSTSTSSFISEHLYYLCAASIVTKIGVDNSAPISTITNNNNNNCPKLAIALLSININNNITIEQFLVVVRVLDSILHTELFPIIKLIGKIDESFFCFHFSVISPTDNCWNVSKKSGYQLEIPHYFYLKSNILYGQIKNKSQERLLIPTKIILNNQQHSLEYSSCLSSTLSFESKNPIELSHLLYLKLLWKQICIILKPEKLLSITTNSADSMMIEINKQNNFSTKSQKNNLTENKEYHNSDSFFKNKQVNNSVCFNSKSSEQMSSPTTITTRWRSPWCIKRGLCWLSWVTSAATTATSITPQSIAQLFLVVNLVSTIASASNYPLNYAPVHPYGGYSQSTSSWSSASSASYLSTSNNNQNNHSSRDVTTINRNVNNHRKQQQQLQSHHHNLHHHHHQIQQQHHANSIASLSGSSSSRIAKDAPEFADEMSNLTVALGRDVVFECVINNLGSYKLAWLKINDSLNNENSNYWNVGAGSGGGSGSGNGQITTEPTLISIQSQMMLTDPRFRVTHNNYRQWFLHIKQIKPSDRGYYMCQINAEPIISQAAFLDILIAPSIDYSATSSDISVDERHRLSIRCRANGYPPPTMIWRREDNKDINLGLYGGKRYSASKVEGEFLNITQVTRDDMGAYLCIASNSVPPSVSKRIIVRVNFRPKIKVSNQLVGSMLGSDVQLECRCEASPTPTTLWTRYDGAVLVNSPKYQLHEDHDSYRTKMKLKIINLDEKDFGSYKCMAKNSLGEKEGLVRLYEIASPSTPNSLSSWPTYIYSYQGRNNSTSSMNNNNNNMLGDHNNDYQQAASSSSSASSASSTALFRLQSRQQSHGSLSILIKHYTILLFLLLFWFLIDFNLAL